MQRKPLLVLRMGSHSEKDYIEKTKQLLDGVIVGANLVEATPGATASLLVNLGGKKEPRVPVYIDPMTYAFGTYVDRKTGSAKTDLDWIKSEQKVKGRIVRDFKRSYRALSDELGGVVADAVTTGRAVLPSDFVKDAVVRDLSRRVTEYQLRRVANIFEADEEYKDFAQFAPTPKVVFAPYFYLDPTRFKEWERVFYDLAETTVALRPGTPVHAILCADVSALLDDAFLNRVVERMPAVGVDGVWLWFSRLLEENATTEELTSLKDLVSELSKKLDVYNMHGGYFSLLLSKFGLSGISHGVGYGEQKDVVPVIGQSMPTVRYYLPPVHRRLGIPQIEVCFPGVGVKNLQDFYQRVCDCVVCKGVVKTSLRDFSAFGEMRRSRPQSQRLAQTPAAAKRCRFHFLLRRIKERDEMPSRSLEDCVHQLHAGETWGIQPAIESDCRHLNKWRRALS